MIDSGVENIDENEDVSFEIIEEDGNEVKDEILVKEVNEYEKEEIIWLQSNLNKLGYNLTVDGSFGPGTKAKLYEFKSKLSTLENNKIFDEKTKKTIEDKVKDLSLEKMQQNSTSTSEIDINKELTKTEVKWLQESLKIAGYYTALDGDFGNNTKSRLYEFKNSIDTLDNNNIYDEKTKEKLNEIRNKKEIKNLGSEMMVVNKTNFLPYDYVPENLRVVNVSQGGKMKLPSKVADQVENLFKEAKADGYNLFLSSAYRSYDYQETIFSRRVKTHGFDSAEKVIAIPGQSEHQTGLAFDVSCADMSYGLDRTFEDTDEFDWLMENCYKYGFILRYRKNKEDITGYIYEPWHYRYIGDTEIAKQIMEDKIVFEEYFEQQ